MSTAIIIGIVVLLGGVVGVFLYLRAQKQKAEAERQRIEAKRAQAEMELKAERKEREAKAEAKMERKIKAMKAESDAKLARLAATARRREQGREKDRQERRERERQDRERRRERERQDRERRREHQEREYQEKIRRRRERDRQERQNRERRQQQEEKRRARQAAARARQAAARSRRRHQGPRPVKAFGRPVGNRVGKTNRGVKRIGKVGKMSGPTPGQRAQIARMSPQRRRMLKVCVRNRRNRGTHRDEALRLCLPRGHKKKYGRRFGGVARAAKNVARKAAKRRAQVKNCARAKERAFVKAQMGARRIGGGGMRRIRMPSRVQRMNWMRDCEANPTSAGNFQFGKTGHFKKVGTAIGRGF